MEHCFSIENESDPQKFTCVSDSTVIEQVSNAFGGQTPSSLRIENISS